MERRNAWLDYSREEKEKITQLCEEYKGFITRAKTERECVDEAVVLAEAAGYRNLEQVIEAGEKLSAGDKVYATLYGKTMVMFCIGKEPMRRG